MVANGFGSQTLNVQGGTYASNRGDHIQVADGGGSSATQNVTINNTTMTSPASGSLGGGITISPAGAANVITHVTNNQITGAQSSAINHSFVGTGSTGTMEATITGNTTTSPGADGIQLFAQQAASLTALVQGNNIQNYNTAGIHIQQGDGSGHLGVGVNATLLGNSILNPGANALAGIYANIGTVSSPPDSGTSCLQIGDSSIAANKNSLAGSAGPSGTADLYLRERFGTTVRLPGYFGSPTDTSFLEAYLDSRNTVGTYSITPFSTNGYQPTASGAPCPQPAP
jgi:hypothetical protein